jgi:4-amino-4-deoxy-L-arabinose transferase-like glycosyltransferase
MNSASARSVVIILAVALLLRLAWALAIPAIPVSDSAAYDAFARTIVEHGVYGWTADQPSAYWPVGTSAIYAGLYTAFGRGFAAIVVLNIALSTAIVGLTMWLGRTFFDDATAVVAGVLMAVWPSEVMYVTILASELPFTFLILLGFAAWFSDRISAPVRGILSGLAFGAACYVRPIALLMPMILLLSAVPQWRIMGQQVVVSVFAMAVIAVTIAPWSTRNHAVFGEFVLLSTNGGPNLWMGNNPDATGYYMPLPSSVDSLSEPERDRKLGDLAKQYIAAEPVAFMLRSIKKAILLHGSETIAVHWNEKGITSRLGAGALFPLKLLNQLFWLGALTLALVGWLFLLGTRGVLGGLFHPIILSWAYFTGVYAITVIQDRYHFPSHPFVAVLAATAIAAFASRARATRHQKFAASEPRVATD